MFLGGCLQVNPQQRLTAATILERLAAIAEVRGFDIKTPLDIAIVQPTDESNITNGVKAPPPRPAQQPCSNNVQPEVCFMYKLSITTLKLNKINNC